MSDPNPSLNPTALSIQHAAMVLTKTSGRPVTVEMLQVDLANGAPTNADGTMNLIYYAAWLVKNVLQHIW